LSDHGHGAVPVDDVGGSLRDAAGYLDRQTVEDPLTAMGRRRLEHGRRA